MSSAATLKEQSALALGRLIKAYYHADGDKLAALAYAQGNYIEWGSTPRVNEVLKTAVAAIATTNDGGALAVAQSIGALLVPLCRDYSIVDRLPMRRCPLDVTFPKFNADINAHQVAEGGAKPLSKFALETLTVSPRKIVGMVAGTDELMRFSDPNAESALGLEIAKAVAAQLNFRFCDPNLGDSIAAGAYTINSGGGTVAALDSDFRSALDALGTDGDERYSQAVWLMSSATAIWLAGLRGTGGDIAYPGVGARGGSLMGLPVLTSGALKATGSPGESSILLVDPNGICYGDDGAASVSVARHASVQLSDTPSSTAAQEVSLWQANMIALRGERWCGWSRTSDTSVVVVDNVNFAG